jgi:hypothetical protein
MDRRELGDDRVKAKVAPASNAAMPMKMPFGPDGFQKIEWPIPNVVMTNVPGFNRLAMRLMKPTFKHKIVSTVEELREMSRDMGPGSSGVR